MSVVSQFSSVPRILSTSPHALIKIIYQRSQLTVNVYNFYALIIPDTARMRNQRFHLFINSGYWYFAERNGTKFGVPSGELKNDI